MNIENAGAIVVGGASGLGAATVRHLHERGAIVTIADVNADGFEDVLLSQNFFAMRIVYSARKHIGWSHDCAVAHYHYRYIVFLFFVDEAEDTFNIIPGNSNIRPVGQ